MKEESDSNSETVLAHHLLSPHNHLLTTKQDSPPPIASSSPSPTSVSSVTSNAKVSSSTNGHGGSPPSSSLSAQLLKRSKDAFDGVESNDAHIFNNILASLGNELASAGLTGLTSVSPEQQMLMTQIATVAMRNFNWANSTRSKSSSSDGSNAGSPLSSVNAKSVAKPRAADSPGSALASTTSTREKVFVCQICNRSFGYKHVLQNHERTHTGEKPFECRECHKRFTRDHHLKTHMRLHTGEKPYHCTHCDRQFVQVANLRRHLRVHTGERPYACELCTSRFSDSNQLKAHMLIHKGEKPFECQKCLGRFRRRHHLMHHKCPKDEANAGKPRRGRRPRAYDQLQSSSPNSLSSSRPGSADELLAHLPLLAATVSSTTANSLASSFYNQNSKSASSLPLLAPPGLRHPLSSSMSMPPNAHHLAEHDPPPKSRRKPRHTIRILPSQHSDLFELDGHEDEDNVQTQPLNLSISPGLTAQHLASHLVLNAQRAYNSNDATDEDVLDLSRSRSDAESEPEPIEEDEDDEDGMVKDEEMEDELDHVMIHHHNKEELKNGKASSNGGKRHLSFHEHYSSKHINNEVSSQLDKNNGLSLELAALLNAQLSTSLKSNGVSRLKPNGDKASSEASIIKD